MSIKWTVGSNIKPTEILGFLESLEREPFLAIFYAYFDESGKHLDHPVVTFAGVCAGQRKLDTFDDAWSSLLRRYGIETLHMKQAADLGTDCGTVMHANQSFDERGEALKPFVDCINEHLELGLIQAWDVRGFQGMDQNLKHGLGSPKDPHFVAFSRAISELVDYVPPNDYISLICDDDLATAWDCYRHYRGMGNADAKIRKKLVSLSFADDVSFPALQAADLAAYLSRRQARLEFYKQDYGFKPLFDYLIAEQPLGKMDWRRMFADENKIRGLKLDK